MSDDLDDPVNDLKLPENLRPERTSIPSYRVIIEDRSAEQKIAKVIHEKTGSRDYVALTGRYPHWPLIGEVLTAIKSINGLGQPSLIIDVDPDGSISGLRVKRS